mmetsp:Transcript_16150/g.19737  ORF Transcript_16150/g.19737 Transcript_16150/m.19737 type:complete len:207 (+) Transcript_16150:297-917(+)
MASRSIVVLLCLLCSAAFGFNPVNYPNKYHYFSINDTYQYRQCSKLYNHDEQHKHHSPKQRNPKLRAKSPPNKNRFSRRIYLNTPVRIIDSDCDDTMYLYSYHSSFRSNTHLQISSGLTFDDGDQLLVSAQKPLGIILEERKEKGCIVLSVVGGGAAEKAGVREGDLLVAVQNVDVGSSSFEEVMSRICSAPKVVNLRFWRRERGT